MDMIIRWAKPISASFSGPLDSRGRYVAVTFDDGFRTVVENAVPELAKRGIPSTIFIISDFLGRTPSWADKYSYGGKPDRIVTFEELINTPSELVVIGSHTVTHPKLTTLSLPDALKELRESRIKLEKLLGRKIDLFSFPYGAFNEQLVRLCHDAGYSRVFTTLPTLAFLNPKEYVTGRVSVEPSDWDIELFLKLFGAYRWLPYAFSSKRRLRASFGFTAQEIAHWPSRKESPRQQ